MLGTVLGGRYKIITILGVGGFGQTYLAEDIQDPDAPRCVVKQFKPATKDPKSLQVARRLFDQEVETLKRLGQHDQIPLFIDFFEDNQEFYLVQEFIDGHSLTDEFNRTRLTEADVIPLLEDVLRALDFVHNNRVIHRDIKPGNLIRRHRDGKIVLIDFGAVKEINTQLAGGTGQTSFTVGIGTQGYTPNEQLAGKPRFCSDIYALGMTAIHGLTGLQPSQLPEDPYTSDYVWQDRVDISIGLAFILDRMVRSHFNQRYQSASEVLQALQRLADLPTDLTEIPPSMLLPESLLQDQTEAFYEDWQDKVKSGLKMVAIATAAVTTLLLGVRQLGWLQPLELGAYDRLVQLRPQLPPDPRLLVVAITEEDLRTLNRATPSDQDVATVIQTLQSYQPRVIGLDLYRDIPQDQGQAALLQELKAPNVISIMNLGGNNTNRIAPPPGVPPEQVGFNDFPIDPDGTVRRNLMFASVDANSYYSFAVRTVLKYLETEGILPRNSDTNPDYVTLGEATFAPLRSHSGAYVNVDSAGYQILLDYRSGEQVAEQVLFTEVLRGTIDPELVKDKIVLIGTTAPSSKDLFDTPFTAGRRDGAQMAGVIVHTQMVSQLLTNVLDQRPLFWFLPEWVEIVWIIGWAIVGGAVAAFLRHPLILVVNGMTVLVVLSGLTLFIFTQQGWVPFVAPALAATMTGVVVIVYRSHRMQQQQRVLTQLMWSGGTSRTFTQKTRKK